jgi:SAM-dependent methyltransferase
VARERRLVFGEVADTYQQARPTYPDGLFDAITELAGLQRGDPILETGAGTGKATEGFLARGFDVTAIEPSAEMAGVLRSRFPDLTVNECGFEDWPLEPHAYAAVVAGQSWHWVDTSIGAPKAADALRPGGWIALFWNRGDLDGCEWHDELQAIYAEHAGALTHKNVRQTQLNVHESNLEKLLGADRFGEIVVRQVPWVERYTSAEYVVLLGTYSDHRMLPDEQRAALHGAIAAAIDVHGGVIEHPYVTDLVAASVARPVRR